MRTQLSWQSKLDAYEATSGEERPAGKGRRRNWRMYAAAARGWAWPDHLGRGRHHLQRAARRDRERGPEFGPTMDREHRWSEFHRESQQGDNRLRRRLSFPGTPRHGITDRRGIFFEEWRRSACNLASVKISKVQAPSATMATQAYFVLIFNPLLGPRMAARSRMARMGFAGIKIGSHYGWMKLEWNGTGNNLPTSITLLGWAYDTVAGEAIDAGQTSSLSVVAEPSTGLMVLWPPARSACWPGGSRGSSEPSPREHAEKRGTGRRGGLSAMSTRRGTPATPRDGQSRPTRGERRISINPTSTPGSRSGPYPPSVRRYNFSSTNSRSLMNPRSESAADRLGRRRLESDQPADGRGQDAEPPAARRTGRDGPYRHAASAAVADALDLDRHRQAAVQARHPRLLRAHGRRRRHPARDQPLAQAQGRLEHPQPERHQEHRHRLVAQPSRPSRSTASWSRTITTRPAAPLDKGWPLMPGTVHPPELPETLAELRLHPRGDRRRDGRVRSSPAPDEIDQEKDRRLSGLASTIAECVSIHSAATWLIENQPWDFFAVYYDAIDHFCHGFMRYHPAEAGLDQARGFRPLLRTSSTTAYRFHDLMLGTLLTKVGDDVTVILMSDHGFHPDHLRPRGDPEHSRRPGDRAPGLRHPGDDRARHQEGRAALRRQRARHHADRCSRSSACRSARTWTARCWCRRFENPPEVATIPSWEEVAGNDGRHPPHTRLDPVASREAMEQLVALGYIAKPDDEQGKGRGATPCASCATTWARPIRTPTATPRRWRSSASCASTTPTSSGTPCIASSPARRSGLFDEMRSIVEDLDGRRRELFTQARIKVQEFRETIKQRLAERKAKAGTAEPEAVPSQPDQELVEKLAEEVALSEPEPEPGLAVAAGEGEPAVAAPNKPEPLLNADERKESARWQNLARFQPPVVEYLMAQVLAMEGSHTKALETLERVRARPTWHAPASSCKRPSFYMKLDRRDEAEAVFAKALEIDPDNPHAHLGMCRMHLRRRDYAAAAGSALESLVRLYHYPLAHFFWGSRCAA